LAEFSKAEKDTLKRLFIEKLEEVYGYATASRQIGMDPTTMRRWRRDDSEFEEACTLARVSAKENLESSMYTRAMKGDTTAGIFMLKAMDPLKYRDRLAIDFNDPLAALAALTGLPKEQLLQMPDEIAEVAAAESTPTHLA
jgi:hypothetical protein